MRLLSEIVTTVTNSNFVNFKDIEIEGVFYDSRLVTEQSLFVAIQGEKVSGDVFIQNAIENGAVVIVSELAIDLPENITLLLVQNARKALAQISNAYYSFPSTKLSLIGITGTNGKTTCSFLLKSLLTHSGKNVGIIGTTGIYFADVFVPSTHTTPESPNICALLVQMLEYGIDTVIIEVSSHSLSLFRVFGLHFSVSMFTNLTQDHLDFHKTMDSYASAKKMLFDMMPKNSVSVFFENDSWATYMSSDCSSIQKIFVTRTPQVEAIEYERSLISIEGSSFNGISFDLQFNSDSNTFSSSTLVGKFNIENLALCLVVSTIFTNIPLKFFTEVCKSITAAPGRMESILLSKGVRAFVDYAHTPDALEKVVVTAKESNPNGRLILVFGCGGNRDVAKRPKMGNIASKFADIIIVTNDNPRDENSTDIIKDICTGFDSGFKKYQVIENRAEAIQKAVEISEFGDCILVAGKGHEEHQIVKGVKLHFSDKEELLKFS